MEKLRPLKSDHSQPHITPVDDDWDEWDDWDDWFEEEDVIDDFMHVHEQPGEQHRDDL